MDPEPDYDLSSFLVEAAESDIGGLRCRKFLAPIEVLWISDYRDWWEIFGDNAEIEDRVRDNIDPVLLLLGIMGWEPHIGQGFEFVCQDRSGRIGTVYRDEVCLA